MEKENKSTIKMNVMFLFFTLCMCYAIYFWPNIMEDNEDVYFLSTASFSITVYCSAFLSPYFFYYNFFGGSISEGFSDKISMFFFILAIIVTLYPCFTYYSDLDTLKTQHSESYCGAELQIGRSTQLLERFSFTKECTK